jgi:hypothetical protein
MVKILNSIFIGFVFEITFNCCMDYDDTLSKLDDPNFLLYRFRD